MERSRTPIWWLFALAAIGAGVLVIALTIELALLPHWPLAYAASLASKLSADYSAEPDEVPRVAPVRPELVFEMLEQERRPEVTIPPGPLSTLQAIVSATPTSTPSPTPRPTNTPRPSSTPTPTPTPTATPTPRPTLTPTATLVPTATAEPGHPPPVDTPRPPGPKPPRPTQPSSPLDVK